MAATLLGVLGMVALNFAPSLLNRVSSGGTVHLTVVDQTGVMLSRVRADLNDKLPNGGLRYELVPSTESPDQLRRQVEAGSLKGFVVLSGAAGPPSTYKAELFTKEALGTFDTTRLSSAFNAAGTFGRLQAAGIDQRRAAALFAPVPLTSAVAGGGAQTADTAFGNWALTYFFVLILYMTMILYGTYMAMGVIEEKSTRVIEVLVSTVRPFQLMMGKVLGLAAAALLQYALWVGTGFALLVARGSGGGIKVGTMSLEFSAIDPWLLVAFLGFFLLGFFTYAGLFAAGGSLVSRTEDAQQITGPLTLILVAVLFVALWAMSNPDAPAAVALSIIPFFSPIVMFVRVAMGHPTWWQLVLSVSLSLVSIVAFIWLAAKVFRAGMLLYGRRMSLRAALRALR
jgi:ABC-2 type transport system permease protein